MKSSLLTFILIGSLSTTLFAQDCNNPLLEFFDLPGLDSPQSGADLQYCNGLIAGETCCSANTVVSFQDRANNLIAQLNNYAAARDLYVAQLRNRYYARFEDLLSDVDSDTSDSSDDIEEIRKTNATLADQLQNDIDAFHQIKNEAHDINNQFVSALGEYQTARTNCFTTALQVQSSAWCLACDPNYANEGVNNDGTITFSDGLCQAISDACWPFFSQGARFNPLINAREAYWKLLAVSRYLDDFSDSDSSDQPAEFTIGPDPYDPLSTQQAMAVPETWSGQAGGCLDLWSGDEQLSNLLTVGSANNSNSNSSLLQNALAGDAGEWQPDLTAVGLDFGQLRNDPGDFFGITNTDSSSDSSDTDDSSSSNNTDSPDTDSSDTDNDS